MWYIEEMKSTLHISAAAKESKQEMKKSKESAALLRRQIDSATR